MRPPSRPADRGGFVLAMVVLMLFAISVTAAAGYMVVNTEFSLATHNREGREALSVAQAGLQRFLAETVGTVGDSVSYAIGDGIATVTTYLIVEEDSVNHLYYIRSEGTLLDLRTPDTPAKRVVGAYARHRLRPLAHHSAVMISTDEIEVRGRAVGVDSSTVGVSGDPARVACPGGGAAAITGAIATVNVTTQGSGEVSGDPPEESWPGGYTEIYDSVDLRWDILTNASFPVDIEQAWTTATFDALPPDSFPLVRYNGDQEFSGNWSGRGVLIVTGEFDSSGGFEWDGIVLAGSVEGDIQGDIRGMLVGGLNAPNPDSPVEIRGDVNYYSCNVYAANESLSFLELLENTTFEAN